MIGYSLGESAGLFALAAWTERDEMLRRLDASPLFRTELAGPCDAARRAWGLAAGEPVDWVAGIVACPAETVRSALDGRSRVYLLIVNTPGEIVIGGDRTAVERLVGDLGCLFVPLPLVSTVHCAVAAAVEAAYRELHLLATTPPPGIPVLQRRLGPRRTPSTARPPPTRSSRRHCTRRLPGGRRARLRRRRPRLRRGRPRRFVHADDRRDPRRPSPPGASGLPRGARPGRHPP